MDKKFLSRILVTAVMLAAAVLWLLSVIPGTQDMFSWFSLAWAAVMLAGALGVKSVSYTPLPKPTTSRV